MNAADEAALRAFPELSRLAELRASGRWMFMPGKGHDGELIEIRAVRIWLLSGSADALKVRYTTDARAVRTRDDGAVVWERAGTLVEVVDALLGLPAPGAPGAPHLARGRTPSGLWVPS